MFWYQEHLYLSLEVFSSRQLITLVNRPATFTNVLAKLVSNWLGPSCPKNTRQLLPAATPSYKAPWFTLQSSGIFHIVAALAGVTAWIKTPWKRPRTSGLLIYFNQAPL